MHAQSNTVNKMKPSLGEGLEFVSSEGLHAISNRCIHAALASFDMIIISSRIGARIFDAHLHKFLDVVVILCRPALSMSILRTPICVNIQIPRGAPCRQTPKQGSHVVSCCFERCISIPIPHVLYEFLTPKEGPRPANEMQSQWAHIPKERW